MKTMRGFTLIELLIVLAIIGILATMGVPSYQQMTANNRMVTSANELIYAFQLARSEATTRARPIAVVAKTGGWLTGWEVQIVDDPATADDETETLKSWPAMAVTQEIAAVATSYQFDAQGRLDASGTLTICDSSRTGESGRQVNLSKIGRVGITTVVCP